MTDEEMIDNLRMLATTYLSGAAHELLVKAASRLEGLTPTPPPPGSVEVEIAVSTDCEGNGVARLIDMNQERDVILRATCRGFYPSHQCIVVANIPPRTVPEVTATALPCQFDPEATI